MHSLCCVFVQAYGGSPSSLLQPRAARHEGGRGRKASKYWGVFKTGDTWTARLWDPETEQRKKIGRYTSEEDAARAYDYAADELNSPKFKERNFPDEVNSEPPASLKDEQSARRTSQFIGVSLNAKTRKWVTKLHVSNSKRVRRLGNLVSEVEAAWKHVVEALKQNPSVPNERLNFPAQVRASPSGPPPQWLLDGKPEPKQP
ncbi:hypothetical protein FOA52_004566 [Chlamydomonas sp. UWO 241]|nr:hypothetical protein FOA52_004566 [Chlamydomonas sp. UWO 241]